MKIQCEVDNVKTLKKGAKITFSIPQDKTKEFMQHISGFMDMPITIEILTDTAKQIERLNQISPEQRKKIYALFKDISEYTGEGQDNTKESLKGIYCTEKQIEDFSLSDCKQEIAGNFINWLIEFAFEHGIPLSENPAEGLSDIESFVKICINKKKCCVCGTDANVYTMKDQTRIPLCEIHKAKMVKEGKDSFKDTFHVWSVAI